MTISITPNPATRLRQNLLTNSFRSVKREDKSMGIQSQHCIGAIERCQQRGASIQTSTYRQAAVNNISTDGLFHCCIAKFARAMRQRRSTKPWASLLSGCCIGLTIKSAWRMEILLVFQKPRFKVTYFWTIWIEEIVSQWAMATLTMTLALHYILASMWILWPLLLIIKVH